VKVFVFSDLEGVSGVCRFEQTRGDGPRYEEARHLLMGDIAACLDGLADAGVDEIIVRDGHGVPYNLVPEEMHPAARYIVGPWYGRPLGGLEPDCDAVVLLGHHAMAATADGILCHTQSSRLGYRYWYNGRETGEIGQEALVAGHFDIPVILVTGDDAACREATDFLGDPVVTVSVKTGRTREGGLLLPLETARRRIRDGAREAVRRLPECRPYRIECPVTGRLQLGDKAAADGYDAEKNRATRVDDRTFEATFETQGVVLSYLI
jgi:D-amino peptidase